MSDIFIKAMDTKLLGILLCIILGIALGFPLGHFYNNNNTQHIEEAQATGGADTIKNLIDPILERAISALEQNNTEVALEELQTVKNELDDTFEADKDE